MFQEIKVGKRVQVINKNLNGTQFIEGYATIKSIILSENDCKLCKVVFENDYLDSTAQYSRWIQPLVIE